MNNKNGQISLNRSLGMDLNLLCLVGACGQMIPKPRYTAERASSNTSQGEKISEAMSKMLWNLEGERPVILHQGQVLFSLRVRARQSIENLEEVIQLDNTLMDNTSWTIDDENAKQLVLNFGAIGRSLSKVNANKTPIFANVSEINATTYLQFATPKKEIGRAHV